MGSNNSKTYQDDNAWENAKKKADSIYNYRIKNYNYLHHGPRDIYMIQVEAEYELECIPEQYRTNSF
jgi:hypothetical protein